MRTVLNEESPLSATDFPVILTYSRHLLAQGLLEPRRDSDRSGEFWLIFMPRFQGRVYMEGPLAPVLTPYVLCPGRDLLLPDHDFDTEPKRVAKITEARLERRVWKQS